MVASAAQAECAWVLWEKYNPPPGKGDVRLPPPQWTIQGADEKQATCDKVKAAVWKAQLDYWQKQPNTRAESAPNMITVYFKRPDGTSDNLGFTQFYCLPDTVDPRGRKGK